MIRIYQLLDDQTVFFEGSVADADDTFGLYDCTEEDLIQFAKEHKYTIKYRDFPPDRKEYREYLHDDHFGTFTNTLEPAYVS